MKKIVVCLLFIVSCLLSPQLVLADYVLPYPSYMPGNKLYTVTRIIDGLKRFWYFGNIAQVKYHLGLSDKYLVEAKTLMEYNQYLLGADALTRSDRQFTQLPPYLIGAKNERADIAVLKQTVQDAAAKHTEILKQLQAAVPVQFTWTPEKSASTALNLGSMIQSSRALRTSVASDAAGL